VLAGVRVASDDDYRVRAYAACLEGRLVHDMSGGSGDIAAAFGALRRIHRANPGARGSTGASRATLEP
jgi:hypothetical protein